jgi:hypothetical protein
MTSDQELQEFAQKLTSFIDERWNQPKSVKWTKQQFSEIFSEDCLFGVNGDYLSNLDEIVARWSPVQNAITNHTCLSFDLDAFGENFIHGEWNILVTTWDNIQKYYNFSVIVTIDANGKCNRMLMTQTPKYAEIFNGIIGGYVKSLEM